MPLKDGSLTTAELRRLIRKHNELMDMKVPKGASRDAIVKLIEDNGYKVDHENKKLIPKVLMKRRPKVPLPPPPPPKKKLTDTEKKERSSKKFVNMIQLLEKEGYTITKKNPIKKDPPKKKALPMRVTATKKAGESLPTQIKPTTYYNQQGWRNYLNLVKLNETILKSNKLKGPFRDSYDFFTKNQDVLQGQSNMDDKWKKWEEIVKEKIEELKKEPKKEEDKPKSQPKKDDKKENEIISLWKKVLSPQLRDAFKSGDKDKMKKTFTKATGILAKYESKKKGISDATARKKIKAVGGSGRLIRSYGENKKPKNVIYEGVNITQLF